MHAISKNKKPKLQTNYRGDQALLPIQQTQNLYVLPAGKIISGHHCLNPLPTSRLYQMQLTPVLTENHD